MIIEIALGIVLAVFILAFIPTVLALAIPFLGFALAVIGLLLLAVAGMWLFNSPSTLVVVLAIAVALFGFAKWSTSKMRRVRLLRGSIAKRVALGYAADELQSMQLRDLESQIEAKRNARAKNKAMHQRWPNVSWKKRLLASPKTLEQERRRALGYDD